MDDMRKTVEKIAKITAKMKADKTDKESVKAEFKDKERKKALTDKERLDRIERILGIK